MRFIKKHLFEVPTYTLLLLLAIAVQPSYGAEQAAAADSAPLENTVITTLKPLVELFNGNPWLQGLTVILATFTIASLITWLLFKILRRLVRRTSANFDDQAVALIRPPIYYTLLTGGLTYGIHLLPIGDNIEAILTKSLQSIGVLVWTIFIIRVASLILGRLAQLSNKYTFIEQRTLTLFDNGAKIVIFSAGLYAIFVIWKIDMTAWLASAGIAGIAVGFAAKDTLSNLFSGVFILADAPYKVGDYIVLDRGDRGKVTNIGLRSTRILTRDDIEITVPNSIIGNATIINQSGGPYEKMRIRLQASVAYGSDIDQVRDILMQIAKDEPLVSSSPAPRVRFRLFGASSLDFELLCWIPNPELRGKIMDSLNDMVYKRFEEAGIEIPYNKQDLYIKGLPETFLKKASSSSSEGA